MADLRHQTGIAAAALQFAILTGARSGEARGATWSEIDTERAVWIIPGPRMKAGKEHRVPLSQATLALLAEVRPLRVDDASMIFPGQGRRPGGRQAPQQAPLTDAALKRVLRRLGRGDLTVHGFRSTFRDWAAETTAHPNHVVELALAHAVGSAVEAAYRRGDLFEKRTALMADWAAYCARSPAEVVALRRQSA
jgi:integrase